MRESLLNPRILFRSVGISGLCLMLQGCGNPFSRATDSAQLFHTPNVNCKNIKLDSDQFDVVQLRNVVHCLNTDGQLNELEALGNEIPDAELTSLAQIINHLLSDQVGGLYAIQSAYKNLKEKNLLEPALKQLLAFSSDPEQNKRTALALNHSADLMADFVFDPQINVHLQNLRTYFESSALRRLTQEQDVNSVKTWTTTLSEYLRSAHEFNLMGLTQLLERNRVVLPTDTKSLQSLSSFYKTLLGRNEYSGFSSVVQSVTEQPVECFDHSKIVREPIEVISQQLLTPSPLVARNFFESSLRALVMTGRGYCVIPYSLQPMFRFTDPLVAHPGFETAYRLMLPLIHDPAFVRFIASPAARQLITENTHLADHHAVQDFFTLIALQRTLPITDHGAPLVMWLDQIFLRLSAQEIFDLLKPLKLSLLDLDTTPLLDAEQAIPSLNLPADSVRSLQPLIIKVLQSKKLANVFEMFRRMTEQKRITPLIDEIFTLFARTIQKGQHVLSYAIPPVLTQDSARLKKLLLQSFDSKIQMSACADLNTEKSFIDPSLYSSKTWPILNACFGDSPTARDLIHTAKVYLQSLDVKKETNFVSETEASIIQEAFKVDPTSAMDALQSFTRLSSRESQSLKQSMLLGSSAIQLVKNQLTQSTSIREWIAHGVGSPLLYQGLVKTSHREPVAALGLSISLWQPEILSPLISKQINALCPHYATKPESCVVDSDQLQMFIDNPLTLAKKIIEEAQAPQQSWIHPKLLRQWSHGTEHSIKNFEYHFNPLLHEIRSEGSIPKSVMSFFDRYAQDSAPLKNFIRLGASHYTLIPYHYHLPDYPVNSKHEYSTHARLRLVSDLDRLELIAIDSDFKPLGMGTNLGMGFIRDIGLSWGDEATTANPPLSNHRSLAETTTLIKAELKKFDRQWIKMAGGWIDSDLPARISNLHYLIPLLDRMQTTEAGGNDGLRVLRNLFYELYAGNSSLSRDHFSPGVQLPDPCLGAPGPSQVSAECQLDPLTLISRITRLGLLHQVGLSVALTPGSAVNDVLDTLVGVAHDQSLVNSFETWLDSPSSTVSLNSVKDWTASLPKNASVDRLHIVLHLLSRMKPYSWMSLVLQSFEQEPKLLDRFSKPLITWATLKNPLSDTWIDKLDQTPELQRWIQDQIHAMTAPLKNDLAHLILTLSKKPDALNQLVLDFDALNIVSNPALEDDLNHWLLAFASPRGLAPRQALQNYIRGPGFVSFCDAFSDTTLAEKTYNFLDKIHQDPDASSFFNTCKAFLFH